MSKSHYILGVALALAMSTFTALAADPTANPDEGIKYINSPDKVSSEICAELYASPNWSIAGMAQLHFEKGGDKEEWSYIQSQLSLSLFVKIPQWTKVHLVKPQSRDMVEFTIDSDPSAKKWYASYRDMLPSLPDGYWIPNDARTMAEAKSKYGKKIEVRSKQVRSFNSD